MSNSTKKSGLGRGLNSLLGGYSVDTPPVSTATTPASPKAGQPPKQVATSNAPTTENKTASSKQAAFHAVGAKEAAKPTPAAPQIPEAARIWKVAVDKLQANENQPRQVFKDDKLRELSDSIKEQGILQPIVARKLENGKFEIVSGERRWRAAQMAGLHDVPVILRSIDNKKSLELAIIENIQRDDLNPIEEAEAYQKLSKEFFMTQDEIAKRVGKDRATVANLLRLLQLHPEVRELLMNDQISQGHAKVLLSVNEEGRQKKLARKVVAKKLSVRQLEKEVKSASESKAMGEIDMDLSQKLALGLAEDLQKKIGTKVQIEYSKGKGKILLHFYSDDQLTQITDKIKDAW